MSPQPRSHTAGRSRCPPTRRPCWALLSSRCRVSCRVPRSVHGATTGESTTPQRACVDHVGQLPG